MASTINADNGVSSGSAGLKSTADSSGVLALQTNGTTAISIDASQAVTFAGAVSLSGNQTTTGNLTVNGNTTLGDASTDTVLMTGAPSIGGAGLGMGMGFRNRIINGAMVIDQRNAGASVTPTDGGFDVDRWRFQLSQSSKLSAQQNAGSVTPPAGFKNYLGITSLSAYSSVSTDYFWVAQFIEGFNTADLGFGSSSASTVTVSFWVRSSLTGAFSGALVNADSNRSYPFSYTISAANTWEQKSVSIAGDQSGTWVGATSGNGLGVYFNLGTGSNRQGTANAWAAADYRGGVTGSVSVVGTNGATFYITGVQLEKGSTATAFDYRPYGTELALCQRYYQQIGKSNNVSYQPYTTGVVTLTTVAFMLMSLPVVMRATPTFTFNGATNTFTGPSAIAATSVISDIMSPTTIMYYINVASGLTIGNGARHYQNAANASSLELSAEL